MGRERGKGDKSERSTGRRLRGAVAQHLGRAIVSGEIAPGERLTGEVANAEALDVSRSAYRKAIQALTAKGLVESRTKAGTCVLPRQRWNLLDPDVLAWAFAGEPDAAFMRDLFELRTIVEPAAARLAAQRCTSLDMDALATALEAMRHHTLATAAGQLADRQFHHAMLAATHNDAIVSLSASIGAAVKLTTRFKQRANAPLRDAIPDHALVHQAICDRDADAAAKAMQALVDLAFQDTRDLLREPRHD